MHKKKNQFRLSTLLWIATCVAVFVIGWILPPPDFSLNQSQAERHDSLLAGSVIQIKGDLFTISLGLDDGLQPGHTVTLFRGPAEIGKALVVNSKTDISACKIGQKSLKSPIQGDVVQFELPN